MNRYRITNTQQDKTFVMTAMSLTDLKHRLEKLTIGIVDYEITLYTVRQANRKPKLHKVQIFGTK